MNELIEILLTDRTTGNHIIWANAEFGATEIQLADIDKIQPRCKKDRQQQKRRTRERAEIFTPPEVCKLQNDLVADERDWQKFVDAKFLEITCGEAPYLVSRYNAVTGETIPLDERVGLLDRKLRVIGEYATTIGHWTELATRAVQSVYGYELQGDNLFLARRNVFETVKDFFRAKFNREPPEDFLTTVAEIISWNLWQMDGQNNSTPDPSRRVCRIKDWSTGEQIQFVELAHGA